MAVAEVPHVLTEPQVAHAADRPRRKPEVRPLDRDLARAVVAIRQRDGLRATGEPLEALVLAHAPPPRDRPHATWADVPATTPETVALAKDLKRDGAKSPFNKV